MDEKKLHCPKETVDTTKIKRDLLLHDEINDFSETNMPARNKSF